MEEQERGADERYTGRNMGEGMGSRGSGKRGDEGGVALHQARPQISTIQRVSTSQPEIRASVLSQQWLREDSARYPVAYSQEKRTIASQSVTRPPNTNATSSSVDGATQYAEKGSDGSSSPSLRVQIRENLSWTLPRQGGEGTGHRTGSLTLQPLTELSRRIVLHLAPLDPVGIKNFRPHAFFDKAAFTTHAELALKDPQRSLPLGQSLEVLRWRLEGYEACAPPLVLTPWPTQGGFTLECELDQPIKLSEITIKIPLSSEITVQTSSVSLGKMSRSGEFVTWEIPAMDGENTKEGVLEIAWETDQGVEEEGEEGRYPISVTFTSDQETWSAVRVSAVRGVGSGDSVAYGVGYRLNTEKYCVE